MRLARKLYEASAADVWRAVRHLASPPEPVALHRYEPVTGAFLRSDEYRDLMREHLPFPGVYDRHEAQNETRSYRFRHGEGSGRLGAFRWRGLQEHLDEVLSLVDDDARVVDLGGAACPIGFRSQVVDRLETDGLSRPVPFRDIEDVPGPIEGIFTSHALEHIPDLDGMVEALHRKLCPGGRLIVHVPSFSCVRWRVGEHSHSLYNDHVWTFGLAEGEKPKELVAYRDIEQTLFGHFEIERAEYCGDDSIFVSATRR